MSLHTYPLNKPLSDIKSGTVLKRFVKVLRNYKKHSPEAKPSPTHFKSFLVEATTSKK
jgi:hypothetical protein